MKYLKIYYWLKKYLSLDYWMNKLGYRRTHWTDRDASVLYACFALARINKTKTSSIVLSSGELVTLSVKKMKK